MTNGCLIHFREVLSLFQTTEIFDVIKLKAFPDDKLNITTMTISFSNRVENTVEKGENAGYQHFLLFPPCFPKHSSYPPSHHELMDP